MDTKKILEHINTIISPYRMTKSYKLELLKLFSDCSLSENEIFEGIEISKKYLYFDEEGQASDDSIDEFLSKLLRVLYNSTLPEIDQKINYIRGICRNRLVGYKDDICRMMLRDYVDSLRKKGYNEDDIVLDLENCIIPMTKSSDLYRFSWWENEVDGWTKENLRNANSSIEQNDESITEEHIESTEDNDEIIYFVYSGKKIIVCNDKDFIIKVVGKNGMARFGTSTELEELYSFVLKDYEGFSCNTIASIAKVINDNFYRLWHFWYEHFGKRFKQ